MARPRTPKARARVTGVDQKNKGRFEDRSEPTVMSPLGEAPEWMDGDQADAWDLISKEIPWLNGSHRMLVEIAATIRARIMTGQECGVQSLNLLRQCLGQMGATPADASKVGVGSDGAAADPADEFLS